MRQSGADDQTTHRMPNKTDLADARDRTEG